MVYVVVGLIIVVAVIVIYGAMMRRRIYRQIDHFETWKIDLMNRPITAEIAKIKELKMVGETEKKFEAWRQDWDDIVTAKLPEIEERLFDAEELADKFRFGKAQQLVDEMRADFETIEDRIKNVLTDIHQVMDSNEQNRKDIVAVKEAFHGLKKELITKRPQFKQSAAYVEAELAKIETDLTQYDKEIDDGNVIKGREILVNIKLQLDDLTEAVQVIPKYYKDIYTVLPKQLHDLEIGIDEMVNDGYTLDHLNITEQITEIERHLQVYIEAMAKAEFKHVEEGLKGTFDQLENLYNLLEREVESRNRLREETPTLKRDLEIVGEKIKDINRETDIVKQGYRIDHEDLKTQSEIDTAFQKLEKEFHEVAEVLSSNQQAFSVIFEKVEDMQRHINDLHDNADAFKEKLTTLRKDELIAKETLQNLRKRFIDTYRKVQKSNIPGIPDAYATILDDADDILTEVSRKLDEKPLEMHAVQQLLEEAHEKVNLVFEKTDEMIESAILTEQLIQYGNRFRSQYPDLNQALAESETHFRNYNYSEAVEVAAAAIYKIDPSIVKRFKIEIEETV
ncbi:septation ring formation regulator EzrA [Camelliibacillus cellulosilyticus]|uniref:Septation ring formation regulator EzrA n=1 Tax=Camelliibacillus cellulosilyticus TaxID=2174486 RepID=A0ABV9GM64_9BACL